MTKDQLLEFVKSIEKENRDLILKQAKMEVEMMKMKTLVVELTKTIADRQSTIALILRTLETCINRLTSLENSIIIPVNETKH